MKFSSILTLEADTEDAVDELVARCRDTAADLAVLFTSHHHEDQFEYLLRQLSEEVQARNLIGCTGESIVGPDCEVEGQPAIVLWLASMPGVRVLPFLLDQEDLQNLTTQEAWIDRIGAKREEHPSFVILADPFTFDILSCLRNMDMAYPMTPKVGGMASGAQRPGENKLFLNDQMLRQGMVGVALSGPIRIDTIVSQGCRPIGKPFVVTKAHDNIIEELGGHVAYDVLKEVFMSASQKEQALMQKGVHVGVVVDEYVEAVKTGDFLVHNLLGVYEEDKLAINCLIRPGQTIQFHVRDADTADEEMRTMLHDKQQQIVPAPMGGLLFSCNGRGRRMFDKPNHDIALINASFTECQIAGFFAQGEIGPVGRETFVHGFTSSLILFQQDPNVPPVVN